MDFMTNVGVNMEIQMYGDIAQIFSTFLVWLQLLITKFFVFMEDFLRMQLN